MDVTLTKLTGRRYRMSVVRWHELPPGDSITLEWRA
jgi:hypothetical protein